MKAAAALVIAVVTVVALVWIFQRRLLYFPFGPVPSPAAVGLRLAEPVTFNTEDGLQLSAWFVPAAEARAKWTILFLSGNGGNRALRAPLAAALSAASCSVLLTDYRGYGGNPGSPSESGLAADARAARRYLDSRRDVDPRRIAYFGESLGSGVAVALALDRPPAALILRSPYTSMVDVGRFHYPVLPVRWLLRDRYDSMSRIARVACPLLVIAGDRDSIVPVAQSRRLFEAAHEPKRLLVIPGADHNDEELLDGTTVIEAVTRFLEAVAPGSR